MPSQSLLMSRCFNRVVSFAIIIVCTASTLRAVEQPASSEQPEGTIAFASLAPRGWDLYIGNGDDAASRITKHHALDYNAAFSPDGKKVAFVSERDGNMELYVMNRDGSELQRLTNDFALDDHPTWSPDGKRIAFVSTRQPVKKAGLAWNAVYVMNADGSNLQRLSPQGTAAYSPAWSPTGDLIAYAAGSGKSGDSDLYVMKPNGSDAHLVVKNGGWPTFAPDGRSLHFHSQRQGRWGIWNIGVDGKGLKRITPEDVSAYTPCACLDGKALAIAVKRSGHRQIELFDLANGTFTAITQDATDHWNPTLAPDGKQVVYHKTSADSQAPEVELWGIPAGTQLQPLRIAGAFPAFSPDGKRIALTGADVSFSTIDVMNLDGSERKSIYKGQRRAVFSTSWAHKGNRIAFAVGPTFQGADTLVNVATVRPDGSEFELITKQAGNNGFPAFSPDGQQMVFRSGRDGHKNLYIMNHDGSNVRRLTDGDWTDTMSDWSWDRKWITFASDREDNFDIWIIRPDGSNLRKVIGGGGRNNHPHFSPDGKWLLFTSQRAGYSAEEVSLPSQPQPYGDLFVVRTDGSELFRLTHNGFEEGTPAWTRTIPVVPKK